MIRARCRGDGLLPGVAVAAGHGSRFPRQPCRGLGGAPGGGRAEGQRAVDRAAAVRRPVEAAVVAALLAVAVVVVVVVPGRRRGEQHRAAAAAAAVEQPARAWSRLVQHLDYYLQPGRNRRKWE